MSAIAPKETYEPQEAFGFWTQLGHRHILGLPRRGGGVLFNSQSVPLGAFGREGHPCNGGIF
jgi:hypothetical protein